MRGGGVTTTKRQAWAQMMPQGVSGWMYFEADPDDPCLVCSAPSKRSLLVDMDIVASFCGLCAAACNDVSFKEVT